MTTDGKCRMLSAFYFRRFKALDGMVDPGAAEICPASAAQGRHCNAAAPMRHAIVWQLNTPYTETESIRVEIRWTNSNFNYSASIMTVCAMACNIIVSSTGYYTACI